MISQTPGMGEPQISSGGRRNVEKTLPTFGVTFAKPFLLQMGYSQPFKIVAFHIFHISVFVNTTAMVVNTYAILHMWMEVIICPSNRSSWKVDDISDPWHRGTSNQLRGEKECGDNFPNLWQWVLQNPSFSKQDIPNLLKFWHLHLSHFCICQYYSYGSE